MCLYHNTTLSVSLIIPVYNVSSYVERCLQSVFNQTYLPTECIIVNDGTQDDSIEKCKNLIDEYKGSISFTVIDHIINRGLSAARNTGTEAASGDYVFYLDSDDEISPDCLEKMVKVAVMYPEAEMIVGNYLVIRKNSEDEIGIYDGIPKDALSNDSVVSLFLQNQIPPFSWNKLIKRTFIRSNHLNYKEGIIYEDVLWLFHVVQCLHTVYFVNDVTYHYYKRPGSLSTAHNDYTYGLSYSVIYDDILQHLQPGKEKVGLNYYVEGLCNCYIKYKNSIPSYRKVMSDYKKLTLQYSCWHAYLKLNFTTTLSLFPIIGKRVLPALKGIRQTLKKLF